jgi:hypothetical protein
MGFVGQNFGFAVAGKIDQYGPIILLANVVNHLSQHISMDLIHAEFKHKRFQNFIQDFETASNKSIEFAF